MERRFVVLVLLIYVGAVQNEQLHDLHVPRVAGTVQGRPAEEISPIINQHNKTKKEAQQKSSKRGKKMQNAKKQTRAKSSEEPALLFSC